jgi:hypothetical protein
MLPRLSMLGHEARSHTAKCALLVRKRTEQVPALAADIFYCSIEMARNQGLVAVHAKWHE